MADIIKAEDLPEKEKVYLSEGLMGWKVVHPIKNDDGTTNYFNLFTGGSIWNVIVIAIIVTMILLVINEYSNQIQYFIDCFESPQSVEVCKRLYGGNYAG